MSDWEQAERVQTNEAGDKRAFIGGSWIPVTKAQKNDQGQFRVMRGEDRVRSGTSADLDTQLSKDLSNKDNPVQSEAPKSKEYDTKTSAKDFMLEKVKRGLVGNLSLFGMAADLSQLPARLLGRAGVPGLDQAAKEGLMSATAKSVAAGDAMLGTDRGMLPPDVETKYAGNVAEFGTAGLIPSSAVIGLAAKKAPAIAGEIAATVGGGLASQLGGDIAESGGHNRALGEIPAAILGAGSAMGIAASTKLGGIKSKAENAVTNRAGKQISEMVRAEKAQPAIEESLKVAKHIEDVTGVPFEPTLAGRTRSGTIGDLENQVLGRNMGAAERSIEKHNANTAAVQSFMDAAIPSGKTQQMQRSAGSAVAKATSNLDTAAAKLAAERGEIGKTLVGKSEQEVGGELDKIATANMKAVKAESSAAITKLYTEAKDKNITANMDDVFDLVKKIKDKEGNAFQTMPPVFRDISERFLKTRDSELVSITGKPLSELKSEPVSFEELHSLWRQTNKELRVASKSAENQNQAHYLNQLKGALESKVKSIENGSGDFSNKFKQWNTDYKSKYVEPFREGIGGRIAGKGRYGDIIEKEDIASKFFSPTGIDDFNKIYGKDPVAKQLLEDGILYKFSRSPAIGLTGEINPQTTARFMRDNQEVLNKLPELKARLSDSTKATEALLERGARIEKAKTDLSRGILAQIAKAPDSKLDDVIVKALSDPKQFRMLMTTGEEGRKAVVRALTTSIPAAASKDGMLISEYLAKNGASIKPILNAYGKDHYKNVKTVMDATDMLERGMPPKHPALTQFSVDPIAAVTGTTLPSLHAQYRAVSQGRLGEQNMAASVLTKFWMKSIGNKAQNMQEYILTNPAAAKDFAAATKATKSQHLSNKISYHALAAGVRSTIASSDSMSKDQNDR